MARNCRAKSTCCGAASDSASGPSRNPPPELCWTCERIDRDANHWAHECPIANARREARKCVLCGSVDHWIRACDKFEPAKHVPKFQPAGGGTRYIITSGARPRKPWCLKCGTTDHATSDCVTKNPAVNFPDDNQASHLSGHCTWCGYAGQNVSSCMCCRTALGIESSSEIESLRNEVASIKESIQNVDTLNESVEVLQRQMSSSLKWQTDVVNPALHRAKATAQGLHLVDKQVADLRSWRHGTNGAASGPGGDSDEV